MKTSSRHIALMGLAVVGTATMVISVAAYSWFFLKIHTTIERSELAASEARLIETKNDRIQDARRIVRSTQIQREELNSYFVTEEDIVLLIEDIEKLGEHAGALVSVQSVSIGKPQDSKSPLSPLYLTLKSEGTFKEVYYTLVLLENFPRALHMSSVRFTQNPTERNWQGVFDIVAVQNSFQSF